MQPADSSGAERWKVDVSYGTRTGHLNSINEDCILKEHLADGTWLLAVADGIGGYEGGEVASALAVATLTESIATSTGDLVERLALAVAEANRRILAVQVAGGTTLSAMGTTLTALAIAPGGAAAVVHIGDSRLYRIEGGRMRLLTVDHNVGTELVREGLIAPEDLSRHPQRNMLTRALGAQPEVRPDLFALELGANDVFLLMSDGMLDAVTEEEACATAGEGAADWARVGPALADLAAERRNGDDATVVAVRISARTEAPA